MYTLFVWIEKISLRSRVGLRYLRIDIAAKEAEG